MSFRSEEADACLDGAVREWLHPVLRNRTAVFELPLSTWEPPIGIEPMTYALRVRRSDRLS